MKKFDWDKFKKGNVAVNCRTLEEAEDFCRKMHEQGLKWNGGDSYIHNNSWSTYRENTCYSGDGYYCDYDYYKKENRTILKWSDYTKNKLRVWWNPQVGSSCDTFYIPVESVEEGKKVMDLLAAYDMFQLQNNIKPNFCNVGGLQMLVDEEWEDWHLETEDGYFEDVDEYCEECERSKEIDKFSKALFEQIDLKRI